MKKCLYCGKELKTVISIHREYENGITVAIKNTPIEVCDNCNEEYFSAEVMEKLNLIMNEIIDKRNETTDNNIIIDYNDFKDSL